MGQQKVSVNSIRSAANGFHTAQFSSAMRDRGGVDCSPPETAPRGAVGRRSCVGGVGQSRGPCAGGVLASTPATAGRGPELEKGRNGFFSPTTNPGGGGGLPCAMEGLPIAGTPPLGGVGRFWTPVPAAQSKFSLENGHYRAWCLRH